MNTIETLSPISQTFPVAGKSLHFPCYFPAVSSVKTNLTPDNYIKLLGALNIPYFLVSAFDLHVNPNGGRKISRNTIRELVKSGVIILLDSGGYESFWRTDHSWTKAIFHRIVKALSPPIAFSFDHHIISADPRNSVKYIGKQLEALQRASSVTSFIPLIHAPKEALPDICKTIAIRLQPIMIAIPERELGDGVTTRMSTVIRIRRAILESGIDTPLHILGTGNPRTLLLLSMAGASSFDGLEWCQTAIDRNTALLYHFQQLEMLKCRCKFCRSRKLDYKTKVFAHNLLFYSEWTAQLRRSYDTRYWIKEATRLMGSDFVKHVCKESGLAGGNWRC